MKNKIRISWAPGVVWHKDNECLYIMNFRFEKKYAQLFPAFYEATSFPVTIDEIVDKFQASSILSFIYKLIELHILKKNIQDIHEIFFSQETLYNLNNSCNDMIRYNADTLKDFVYQQNTRNYFADKRGIPLTPSNIQNSDIQNRRSVRSFKSNEIAFSTFSNLLQYASSQTTNNEQFLYSYPSAGALYPIDIYLYIKDNRIENLVGGFYYFNPLSAKIYHISSEQMKSESHYFLNKEIFDTSAFSVFYVYNASSSFPKYGGSGYFYAILDTGILMGLLSHCAELYSLSSCIIGDMEFHSIKKHLLLNDNQRFVCAHEFGIGKYEKEIAYE